jgi:hypothetical protein
MNREAGYIPRGSSCDVEAIAMMIRELAERRGGGVSHENYIRLVAQRSVSLELGQQGGDGLIYFTAVLHRGR